MPSFGVEVSTLAGLEKITERLDRIAAGSYLRAPMLASVIEIETWMKHYPPPPDAIQGTAYNPVRFTTRKGRAVNFMAKARGRYVRTGKLGQSWSTRVAGDGNELTGTVGTNIKYAPYVQSAAQQARIHQGRWRTDEQAIAQFRDRVIARFQTALQEALR